MPLAEVELLPPLLAPEKFLCIGINYDNRERDYDVAEPPKYPSLFYRAPSSLVGSGQNLIRPKVSEQLDYEGEIALVIGRECRHVANERALDVIAGLRSATKAPSATGPGTANSTSRRARISTPAAASGPGS